MIILLHTETCYISPHVFTIADEQPALDFGPSAGSDNRSDELTTKTTDTWQ